jgi:hypothetical protein
MGTIMQRCFILSAIWLACFAGETVMAAEQARPAVVSRVAAKSTKVLVIQLPQESVSTARTRYRRLHGRWWYWLPSENQWALWDGGHWTLPGRDGSRMPVVASRTISGTVR